LSGDEAIEKALELRPDIVLMDINLGIGLDGIEAAGLIRDLAGIPVVYLTAHSDEATLQRAKLTEPFGFVIKPYEDRDLRIAIEIGLHKSEMEQQLRKSQQWFEATLSSIGDGVIAVDTQGCVSFMNSLAEELTGWPLADAIGKEVTSIFQIVEEATRKTVPSPILESLHTGNKVGLAENTVLINRDGSERYIADSASPIKNFGVGMDGAVIVFKDITQERSRAERLKQAQSLEAVGRIASGLAHDFNNIMTSIINYSQVIRDVDMSPEQRRTMVEHILAGGNRAASLTQQIVAFSRKQMLVPRLLDLNAYIKSMASQLERVLGERIELRISSSNSACQVKFDPMQLEQVLVNLASNARDAMPDGGQLVITTSLLELGEAATFLDPDVKPGRYVSLSIADTGIGMNEDVQAHIFEPFFTTKGTGKGIGLGLSTVYGIIKQSGGHIDVTSKLGVGTTFSLLLPHIEEPASQQNTKESTPTHAAHVTILLVDDEDSVRASTKMLLKALGYTVVDASSGEEALSIAQQYAGPIHLLLTDLQMPQISGRELAEKLVAVMPETQVLYMSGFTDDEHVRQNLESETTHFLQKPFNLASLNQAIRKALDNAEKHYRK
jgi:two-component system, cell cycle sensor histidine kinase and response regulator CckA